MEEACVDLQKEGQKEDSQDSLERFYSVEFSLKGVELPYQFRIWNMVPKSMCVLVREDSHIVERLRVGDVLNMKYYGDLADGNPKALPTRIKHITKDERGRFKGHYMVGLAILDQPEILEMG